MRKRRLTRAQIRNRRILATIIGAMAAMLFLTSFFVKPRYESAEVYREYIIEPEDTLYSICGKFYGGCDWRYKAEEIARTNGIRNQNMLVAGDMILIPETEKTMQKVN